MAPLGILGTNEQIRGPDTARGAADVRGDVPRNPLHPAAPRVLLRAEGERKGIESRGDREKEIDDEPPLPSLSFFIVRRA